MCGNSIFLWSNKYFGIRSMQVASGDQKNGKSSGYTRKLWKEHIPKKVSYKNFFHIFSIYVVVCQLSSFKNVNFSRLVSCHQYPTICWRDCIWHSQNDKVIVQNFNFQKLTILSVSASSFCVTYCRVRHNAKQAITLKSASSKVRNDILKVIIATYRLKEYLLESGNKIGIAQFETSKFRCHASDG